MVQIVPGISGGTPPPPAAATTLVIYDSATSVNNGDLGEGVLHLGFDFLPAGTYDAVTVSIAVAGASGAVARVVAYGHTDGAGPTGAPLVDVTVAATATTSYGVVTLGTPLVIPAPGRWVWRGIVTQGAAVTKPSYVRVVGGSAFAQQVAVVGQFLSDFSPIAAKLTGVSGTPPTNPTVAWDRHYHRVGFRRA